MRRPLPKEKVLRFDWKRDDKTTSSDEWESDTDPDAKIASMKCGTTPLAYSVGLQMSQGDFLSGANERPVAMLGHGEVTVISAAQRKPPRVWWEINRIGDNFSAGLLQSKVLALTVTVAMTPDLPSGS